MTTSSAAHAGGVVLVDTSCWIEYFHPQGSKRVKTVLRKAILEDRVAVCGPVICEIVRGAARAERTRLRKALDGQVRLVQEDADWEDVGRVVDELQQEGLQPPILDALIAAIATRHGVALWHFGDRHFGPISRRLALEVVDLRGPNTR